jgi:hypothetical protein
VAASAVLLVEGLRVAAVQHLHPGGERFARTLNDEVEVVVHEAECAHLPAEAAPDEQEEREPVEPVVVVADDPAAVDSARGDVVDPVGEQGARNAGHRTDGSRRRIEKQTCGQNVAVS